MGSILIQPSELFQVFTKWSLSSPSQLELSYWELDPRPKLSQSSEAFRYGLLIQSSIDCSHLYQCKLDASLLKFTELHLFKSSMRKELGSWRSDPKFPKLLAHLEPWLWLRTVANVFLLLFFSPLWTLPHMRFIVKSSFFECHHGLAHTHICTRLVEPV